MLWQAAAVPVRGPGSSRARAEPDLLRRVCADPRITRTAVRPNVLRLSVRAGRAEIRLASKGERQAYVYVLWYDTSAGDTLACSRSWTDVGGGRGSYGSGVTFLAE